jgi:Spy/CpxP family protein refolding chaperone
MAQPYRMRNPEAGGAPPDPATMIEHRVSFLKTVLSLTDAQATQATTIYTNAAEAAGPLRTQLSTARESIRDAVKNNNAAAIEQLSATIGALTGQMTAIQSKAEAAFYAILSADQRTKYDEVGRGPFGPGGFRPGGGRSPRTP